MSIQQVAQKRRSPHTTIVIVGFRDNSFYHDTVYDGSALKGGTALMKALLQASSDPQAEEVYYFEGDTKVKIAVQHGSAAKFVVA
jgi:hypothetical protein